MSDQSLPNGGKRYNCAACGRMDTIPEDSISQYQMGHVFVSIGKCEQCHADVSLAVKNEQGQRMKDVQTPSQSNIIFQGLGGLIVGEMYEVERMSGNEWAFDVWKRVDADYDNSQGSREKCFDDERYVLVAGDSGFMSREYTRMMCMSACQMAVARLI